MFIAFDILFITLAVIIMMWGLSRRWALWQMKFENRDLKLKSRNSGIEARSSLGDLIRYLLGHEKILGRKAEGKAHLILFIGFAIPLMVAVLAQFGFTVPRELALPLSFLTDVLGLAMLVGTVFFLMKRIGYQESKFDSQDSLVPVIILLIILITGFLAEGARLSILHPGFSPASPVGWLVSIALPQSPHFMQLMIRIHFYSVLIFFAIIPFTFMRHIASASLNVYYRKKGPRGELTQVALSQGAVGARTVRDLSWKQLLDAEACVSCGRCDENCPALISGKPLSPRKVIRNILEQMEGETGCLMFDAGCSKSGSLLESAVTKDEIWACTTCLACVEQCPIFVEPLDKIVDIRRYQVMGQGALPDEAQPMIRDLELFGDAQGRGPSHRADWALNRDVPVMSGTAEFQVPDADFVLLWVGCSGAFHPMYQETTRAMVKILNTGGVRFGILGKEESCCGDSARRLGEESLFADLARKNINRLNKYNVQKIVTLCPHCLNTLKNEYPMLGGNFEVTHATELIASLIQEKRITLKYPVMKPLSRAGAGGDWRQDRVVMAVHDACYLGRYNHIYEPLREVCQAVPGVYLKELERNHENGFCCGGGGGRMWLHENIGRNINHIRAEEVSEAGVDVIGTACPYCLTMLDDGVKALETENPPRVSDIIEIVAASIEV